MDRLQLQDWLKQLGLGDQLTHMSLWLGMAFVVACSYLAYLITRFLIDRVIHRAMKHAPERWHDALVNNGFFRRCANLAPVVLIHSAIPLLFTEQYEDWQAPLSTALSIYLTWVITAILTAATNVAATIYAYSSKAREVPITGVIQVIKLVLVLMAVIITVAIIMDKSPLYLLSGFGAMTAILVLVFRDSLMGFVAGIQLASNRMVGINDWIEVPDHEVNGIVKEVGLITVKVENWDKTIVYLPTYTLIHQSFKNWQGMVNTQGRRMKAALLIDISSIKPLQDDDLNDLCDRYLDTAAEQWLQDHELTTPVSNITLFRHYTQHYLRNHPKVRDDLTCMARLLQPTAAGLPLEVYAFSKDTDWVTYEGNQASIIEHLYSVLSDFGLRSYQYQGVIEKPE